jgi:hypothetical protein
MRQFLTRSVGNRLFKIAVSLGFVLSFATSALAGPPKVITVYARGNIVSQAFCSATEVCQEAEVAGTATVLGRITGVLSERVDITNGTYTGTGVFTMSDHSTITTEYTGEVTPPDRDGRVFFVESHHVVSGTGQYANASGDLDVVGTGDVAGRIQIVGLGTLRK